MIISAGSITLPNDSLLALYTRFPLCSLSFSGPPISTFIDLAQIRLTRPEFSYYSPTLYRNEPAHFWPNEVCWGSYLPAPYALSEFQGKDSEKSAIVQARSSIHPHCQVLNTIQKTGMGVNPLFMNFLPIKQIPTLTILQKHPMNPHTTWVKFRTRP